MRILHTADWHLGRIFYRTHLTEDQAYVLAQVVDIVRTEKPDVVVVAGDVYDRAVPPPDAVRLLDHAVSELVLGLDVPLLMISGNHDSPGRLGYASRMLSRQKLHVHAELSSTLAPVTFTDDAGPVDFYCVPYTEPAYVRQAIEGCTARTHDAAFAAIADVIDETRLALPTPNARRAVLIGHLHAEGGVASESERPLVFGGTAIVSTEHFDAFDYVALGHLHRPQNIGTSPRIRYSGSLMKYSFDEASDIKSVSLVDLGADGSVRVETIPLDSRRDVRRLKGHFADLMKPGAVPGSPDDYLEITLLDEGEILDAIGQLRMRYPNVLHIRRPAFSPTEELDHPDADHRSLGTHELFSEFFRQVTGTPLGEAEDSALVDVLNALGDAEGERA